MKSNKDEINNWLEAPKNTRIGRRLKTLIDKLSLRIVLYRKKSGPKPEVSGEIFDLATQWSAPVVNMCSSREDYRDVMAHTIGRFSDEAADYVLHDMEFETFSRYCGNRKRFTGKPKPSVMRFLLKATLFDVPYDLESLLELESVIEEMKVEQRLAFEAKQLQLAGRLG